MKIILELPDTCILVQYPTGIFYTSQVGGHSCYHPEEEGFYIPLHQINDFTDSNSDFDCNLLCRRQMFDSKEDMEKDVHYRQEIKERAGIVHVLNERLKGYSFLLASNMLNQKMSIDEDRIYCLTEGWWPVKFLSNNKEMKGIVHFYNCD